MGNASYTITVCSDSVGETAEAVVRAAIRQFEAPQIKIKRYMNVRNEEELRILMEEAAESGGFVAYTLVQPELREAIKEHAIRLHVRAVDVMGPMIQAFVDTFEDQPKRMPGLLHRLDDDYFQRVEAVEFAVKCDDGKDLHAILKADIVLLGVSRTSKTPLSVFLAHKGKKVVNYPVVPEIQPPEHLYSISPSKIIGLTMNAEHLLKVRSERLKTMGLPVLARYASLDRIVEELENARSLFDRLGCPVIDVTDKAIEETAGIVMDLIH
ncbi:kinase/pyrophosphorylase [Paenibacillus alvei]|uniref:Putative pyruvate, phosphate dikinase regulatory protein n=1 Tax=Paenibacillus alvei TaxID=44250 RepID=A0AAP6ZWK8_PAEAL|nr:MULTISPECIES: pyruvate, water dikinase regulatory protein [Paenibacillus]EJW15811.1 putative phosphotransferase [Paenibacillus alvei DSM 29]MBG9736920.1 phosphotransferase [Paenibacillus alvei]MBG9746442.1 phosphotransferase [Paenibacillus alvei]MCY7484578.1 kinase/pyrophosphorylase [Paenibacillus alvei]MCY9542056.1 kinase/pyrophosphorylase [Paenibacillus alvei]